MKPNRWLPYGSLQSRHLRPTLATARIIAWIGMLLIAAGIAWGIMAAYFHFAASGPAASMTFAIGVQSTIGLIGYGLLALALSGVLAALVGIEESQRRRVERE
jgi:hypothetical protein